jgi:hypothetical protein
LFEGVFELVSAKKMHCSAESAKSFHLILVQAPHVESSEMRLEVEGTGRYRNTPGSPVPSPAVRKHHPPPK